MPLLVQTVSFLFFSTRRQQYEEKKKEQTYDTDNRARNVVLEEVVQHVLETKSDLLNFTQTPSIDN